MSYDRDRLLSGDLNKLVKDSISKLVLPGIVWHRVPLKDLEVVRRTGRANQSHLSHK